MVKRRKKDLASTDYVISNFAGPYVKWILVVFSLVSVIFPLYWLTISAFKLEQDYRAYPPVFFPSQLTLDSFIEVFTKNQLMNNLINSATISVVTTVITLLIGEGGSGGALALSVADRVWMLENSVYSVISPEGCASILWKDAAQAPEAAQRLKLTAQDALELGIIEAILTERDLGQTSFYSRLAGRLEEELRTLQAQKNLTETRYARFRAFGRPKTSCPTE